MECIVKDKDGMLQHGIFFGIGEEINLPRVLALMLEEKKIVAIKKPAVIKKQTEREKE